MKNILNPIKIFILLLVCGTFVGNAQAQDGKRLYFNIDWQLNLPVQNDFAKRFSGWGAHGEVGYYVAPSVAVGAFVSYHTNNKYIDRSTIHTSETSAITTDQQHSIFQIPFGALVRFTPSREGMVEPYIGAKVGTSYSEVSSHLNIYKVYDREWGFYISPEVGVTFYFTPEKQVGLHLSTYYNYSTQKSEVLNYEVDGLNNWGGYVSVWHTDI